MAHWTVAVCLSTVLFMIQQATCDWTFSLRVDSGRCCPSASPCTQEQIGSCEDLYIGLCLRTPDTPLMDRGSCPVFFFGNGTFIIGRELTPADDKINHPVDITTTEYQGGVQIYAGVTLMPDIPQFRDGVDEILVTAEPTPGGGEISVTGEGENQRASLIFLIKVDCSPGYGGDDCLTLNMCSDQITCNQTLGYCSTTGECVCYDGTTQCAGRTAVPCDQSDRDNPCDETTELTESTTSNKDDVAGTEGGQGPGFGAGIGVGIAISAGVLAAASGTLALLIHVLKGKKWIAKKEAAVEECDESTERISMEQNTVYGMKKPTSSSPTTLYEEICS